MTTKSQQAILDQSFNNLTANPHRTYITITDAEHQLQLLYNALTKNQEVGAITRVYMTKESMPEDHNQYPIPVLRFCYDCREWYTEPWEYEDAYDGPNPMSQWSCPDCEGRTIHGTL